LEALPPGTTSLALADESARPGAAVHTVGHPAGVDLMWLYAAGVVRQTARVRVSETVAESSPPPRVALVQFPAQGGDGGGAVVDDRGRVVAALTGREAPQQAVAYAVEAAEVRRFVDGARAMWDPVTADEWERRGRHLLKANAPAAAMRAFEKLQKLDAPPTRCLTNLSEASRRAGDSLAALGFANTAVGASPRSPRPLVLRAAAHIGRGELPEAVADSDAALRLDAKCAEAYAWRAEARRRRGESAAALADCDEAIWLDPNLAEAYWHRALLRAGDDALVDCGRAAELDPYRPEFYRHRAGLREAKKDLKQAAGDLERALELAPFDPETWQRLARVYAQLREPAKAWTAFRHGLRATLPR
jgi:tetratricopeptide (TPR) repeat protein